MLRKIIATLVAVTLLLFALFWGITTFFPERLIPFLLQQQLARQIKLAAEGEALLNETEGITLFTIGTASPIPGERVQTGTAVFVNGHFFLFDVGDGVVQKAENMGLPLNRLDGIFMTHWHSDHMIDLPSVISRSWLLGRNNELHIYGPDGLDTLNQAINQFLHIENQHRIDHHGPETMDISIVGAIPHEFKNEPRGTVVVYEQDGITITAFDVNHAPIEPAVGYVIEYKGKKVVLSGDTVKDELLIEMAQDADLLLHEVMLISVIKQMTESQAGAGNSRNVKILTDIQDYHTSPRDVADIAVQAGVKQLVLNHFAPAPDFVVIRNLYKKELSAYKGPIHFPNDGDKFVVD